MSELEIMVRFGSNLRVRGQICVATEGQGKIWVTVEGQSHISIILEVM